MALRVDVSFALVLLVVVSIGVCASARGEVAKTSRPIASVLRDPLPPEELGCTETDAEITVQGPTFTYTVTKSSGAIAALRVVRDGEPAIESLGPADLVVDGYRWAAPETTGRTEVVAAGKDKVLLRSEGALRDAAGQGPVVRYTAQTTLFNDGVVVCELKLAPDKDLVVRRSIEWRLPASGRFASYLHKRRDHNGHGSDCAKLPEGGKSVRFATLSSCLQVFSPEAALAIFTDGGSTHVSSEKLDTAVVEVKEKTQGRASVALSQYVVHVAPDAEPYVLKADGGLAFRVGVSVAPNRLPHRRTQDLRMFVWIGDAKYPYPTDAEIGEAARLGYTLFQLHRVGTPGEPRPPAGELERVLETVHDAGMLFVWEENTDLLYANAPGVVKMKAEGKWPLWQGFNYGGRYTASMDPYCDMAATCIASPNGLAEYRLANLGRMLDRYAVDGIYLDDNLAYPTCTLWQEHGHPHKVYDCLIELHEMNWRRRELLRNRCPHAVLIGHCANALVLPVIGDFDAHLYGEGYGFGSLEDYWDLFGSVKSLYGQGQIWPGDSETSRCAASIAYNYDLLTGGGQFEYCDWRLFPAKLPYAKGVTPDEALYVKTYNLAQYYFGMYESEPHYFANSRELFTTSAPLTYATVFSNRIWKDCLIPVVNMARKAQTTSLAILEPEKLGLTPGAQYALYDVNERTLSLVKGDAVSAQIAIPKESLKLLYLRPIAADAPCHIWGGKRIAESADATRLTVEVQAPAALEDVVVLSPSSRAMKEVLVNGKPAEFFLDPAKRLIHGNVVFAAQPVKLEAVVAEDGRNNLPEKPLLPDALSRECLAHIAD